MQKIGIDFDNVMLDNVPLKIRLAKEWFGFEMDPVRCTIHTTSMPQDQYAKIMEAVYSSEAALQCPYVDGCEQGLARLAGKELHIITARNDIQKEYALRWLKAKGIKYASFSNTCDQPKIAVAQSLGIECFLDDSIGNLEEMLSLRIPLYLLDRPYNRHKQENNVIRRVNWQQFVDAVLL